MPFEAGEGVADITPPMGVELAGFHKPPGKERRCTGARQPSSARVLAMRLDTTETAIVVLDVLAISATTARTIADRVSKATKIPAQNIRVCATHSHSAPALAFFRQWGAISPEYQKKVEEQVVAAALAAKKDLVPADLYYGRDRVDGGNFNRTIKTWKTDVEFDKTSTDSDRWLDTTLHALYFQREKPKQSLLWYQFSSHPVCYTDTQSGPDWPGLVVTRTTARDELRPAFLQGHCGDVNPGSGAPYLGDPEKVAEAVYTALHHATNHSELVIVDQMRVATAQVELPFDLDRLRAQIETYEKDPAACTKGEWVDAAFAKDWHEAAKKWDKQKTTYGAPLSAIRLGELALLFQPSELYSYYGLAIQRDSPLRKTIPVGYADDYVGYVPDPTAYEKSEYAALVVPKITGLPPFTPEALHELTRRAVELLKSLA